jgi:hypothetical protein
MKCKSLIILLYSWLLNENQMQKSGNDYYYYYFSLLAIETYGKILFFLFLDFVNWIFGEFRQ